MALKYVYTLVQNKEMIPLKIDVWGQNKNNNDSLISYHLTNGCGELVAIFMYHSECSQNMD